MCGIAGIFHPEHDREPDRELLVRMCDRIAHRGPDDHGIWTGAGGGLGHRRLSIIDLSAAGAQPMCNEDGTVWTAYNGEIYNFAELRAELAARGHRFKSATDSEVIVHLYEEVGDALVERLEGMFAFAVWDTKRRRLLLARDRVGKKPLKYASLADGSIVFASELKALLASGAVPRDVDPQALHLFLGYGYVPGPHTGFSAVRKLPPGHTLTWEAGRVRLRRYWQLDFSKKRRLADEEWKEAVRETVRRAVRKRLVSDVPLGAFLSGGIDSTIVVALMAQELGRPVETFSIGFEYEKYDELPYARQVAERYGTSHHEFVVRADAAEMLPRLAEIYEEPYADSSALPSWFLARETRRFVKVALNGDGGDEGFAGYTRYKRLESWAPRLRWVGQNALHALARRSAGGARNVPSSWVRGLDKVGHVTHRDPAVRYAWMVRLFSDREKAALYRGALRPLLARPGGIDTVELMRHPQAGEDSLDRMLYADTMLYLPDDLLVKMDLATMAHSLEARSPLLDAEVLELAASAPAGLKFRDGRSKWLLKEAFREEIPEPLLDRRKQGFGIPLDEWFRGPLRELTADLLLVPSARLHEYLRPEALRTIAEQHTSGEVDHGQRLWALVMLELWHRRVVDPAPAAAGAVPAG
jgi:asparagine synthase (glutamine-hydrolysing)